VKCPQHKPVFDARTGEIRGQPLTVMPRLDKLSPEFLEAMARMAPIFARTEGRPLTPLRVEVSNGTVRAFVCDPDGPTPVRRSRRSRRGTLPKTFPREVVPP
jgi:hypothetical protein